MILDRYLVKQFVPVFIVASVMFVMLMILIDLFVNLVHYLNYEATFKQILKVSFYYLPKSFSYALPISLLFAVAYTLGDLYARNELTSIISSGIPFWRLTRSLLIIGLMASFFAFFFEDRVVIPTLKVKNDLGRTLRHQTVLEKNSNIVMKTRDGQRIYSIDYYDYQNITLNGLLIVERDEDGSFSQMIRAASATWDVDHWAFNNAVIYAWEGEFIKINTLGPTTDYTEDPEIFTRSAVDPAELSARDARYLVRDLRDAGLPAIEALADFYHRFSFSTVSFIVVILSISMGGRFRKNIMLMSLLTSLGTAVVFYIVEMITMMMGKMGYIPPLIGAWFPVFLFIAVGVMLVRYSKT
ncbi:MAG: LptF/LptG family permease [Termitinemataceae bacterium]|nr:MAG: LptF/LptG family permease [Termitinemataceae bacterium]